MERPPFDSISADRVEVSRSAVRSVSANVVGVQGSALQNVAAAQASLKQSAVGLMRAEKAAVEGGFVGVAMGREIALENASAVFLLSPSVSGNVRAAVTLPAAFAIGLGFFAGRWLTRIVGRLLRG